MKLSVVINTYNQVAFVVEAIESVLMQQTTFDFEIVVVDDCSTDGTREILISYADKYPGKIRLILYETNQALADTIEMLLRHATADYIALLEGDDYWTDPEKLQTQVAFLDANPDYVLCGHNCVIRNEWTNTEVVRPDGNEDLTVTLTTRELIHSHIPTASMVFRNRLLDTWPECFMRLGFGDRPLQIMLSELGKVLYFTRPMSVYRIHSGGVWSSKYVTNLEKPIPDTTPEGCMKLIEYWEILSVYLDHQYDEDIFKLIANTRDKIFIHHPHRMKIQYRWKVFTIIYRPTPLLVHFVRHYAALGFTDIVIAASALCAGIDWDAIRTAAAGAEIHIEPLYPGVFDNARDTAILNSMKARYVEDRDEWSAQTDLDEFYEFPLPLGELAATAGDANCVQGFFVDRIAADGSLPPIRDDVPIAEQFPVETRITKRILGGQGRKLMLTRGFQNIGQGHHRMADERLFRPDGRVLHYKWNSSVLEHLGERMATSERTDDKWRYQSERFLAYWQRSGRIIFADCM
jgi:glycosyltransferase involved in cell wall biosynthesis